MSNVEGRASYDFSYIENMQVERETKAGARQAAAGGSYLMALAIMLGEIADKMLERTMQLAEKLDNLQDEKAKATNDGKDPGGKGENRLTAELQAQTQIMSMFMQAMTTVIKTVGEANKDVARKQ